MTWTMIVVFGDSTETVTSCGCAGKAGSWTSYSALPDPITKPDRRCFSTPPEMVNVVESLRMVMPRSPRNQIGPDCSLMLVTTPDAPLESRSATSATCAETALKSGTMGTRGLRSFSPSNDMPIHRGPPLTASKGNGADLPQYTVVVPASITRIVCSACNCTPPVGASYHRIVAAMEPFLGTGLSNRYSNGTIWSTWQKHTLNAKKKTKRRLRIIAIAVRWYGFYVLDRW